MRCMQKVIMVLAMTVMIGISVPGHASTIQLFSPSELNSAAMTALYTGDTLDILPSPYILTAGGNGLTFTLAQGDFRRADQGNNIGDMVGNFAPGTKLLYTNTNTVGGIDGGGLGPIDIAFSVGVAEVGFRAQNDFVGPESFFFSVFNGGALLGDFCADGISGQVGNDTTTFLGVRATEGDVITQLIVTGVSGVPYAPDNDFAIGPVSFTSIPEPMTIVLLGMGIFGMIARCLSNKIRPSHFSSHRKKDVLLSLLPGPLQ